MHRIAPSLAALLITAAGCGGGADSTPAAPPTTPPPVPTPPPTPEPEPPPEPPIEITPVARGISVTSENQILLELMSEDLDPANPLDLAGRTLMFTPAGGGYSRAVRPLDWEEEAGDAERMRGPAEVALEHFRFPFAGQEWDSFFYTRPGLISFGEPIPRDHGWPKRFGTMPQLLELLPITPMISALSKPHLGGNVHVSKLSDRVIVGFFAWDREFAVYGQRPRETFDFQIVLHADGRIALNYGTQPEDPDEAFGDGIVGVFTTPEAGPRPIDLSRPDSRPSTAQYEAFRYPMIRDGRHGVAHVSCRIIEVLGDEFDFMAFNSQFRVDQQEAGPAHGFAGYYWGNIGAEADGVGTYEDDTTTPCESRLKNTWGFPTWMKADTVVDEVHPQFPGQTPYDPALTYFAHEIGHTWLAYAHYLKDGEQRTLRDGSGHWELALHAPAPFPRWGTGNGSVMGGAHWRENSDGTFTATSGWATRGGGFSWLDLYLMGLATPDEVPDMFVLRNPRREGPCTFEEEWECERFGPFAADKEIVTIEQVLAAMGPRNPPSERARKVFNTGFVYFLLPGQEPDPELLREHADYRDRALEHWRDVTGGRGQLKSELPGQPNN
jgi:hypothetical protein